MASMGLSGRQTYKVKLTSGRILGPLDLERVRLLILKNQITGTEVAREYPQGEWVNINQIPQIADLLVAKASGSLAQMSKISNALTATAVLPGATQVLPSEGFQELPDSRTEVVVSQDSSSSQDDEDRTMMASLDSDPSSPPENESADDSEKTRVAVSEEQILSEKPSFHPQFEGSDAAQQEAVELGVEFPIRNIAQERTVLFQRSSESRRLPGKKKAGFKEILKAGAVAIILGILGHDLFLDEAPQKALTKIEPIRPTLPHYAEGKADPKESQRLYNQAFRTYYILDTVEGYKLAAKGFLESASKDISNVQALAMLASSYLNLIDSSNKDENYFSVISKLIDMSRAKAVDLPQTVFADVEFYLVVNKAEAAENRVVEYTTTHKPFEIEMFYYLALAFLNRGDAAKAAKYISNLPDKTYTARFSYLKGQIAERLQDQNAAFREYEKAIKINSTHAKSRLRLAYLLNKQGKLKEASPHLEFLMKNTYLLPPKELGEAYYLHALLAELFNKRAIALGDVERAVKLDPENHDYLLELYTLRAGEGDSGDFVKRQARMYFYLGEGEKLVKSGRYQEALVPFLQARQVNDQSPLPLIKIGDMFDYLHDIENAKNNYKLAADRAPNNIQVWSKYIKSLIQSYEWEDASKAMDRFRKLPVSQSAIDKAAADMYEKQGRHVEAQTFYKKAMARDVIDPEVYTAYAKSLMSTRNFK
jgi:tetratricopeptide (TPR) repeat protein